MSIFSFEVDGLKGWLGIRDACTLGDSDFAAKVPVEELDIVCSVSLESAWQAIVAP